MVSPGQVVAARALLGIGQAELAEVASVSRSAVAAMEQGRAVRRSTVEAIRRGLEGRGVVFLGQAGSPQIGVMLSRPMGDLGDG